MMTNPETVTSVQRADAKTVNATSSAVQTVDVGEGCIVSPAAGSVLLERPEAGQSYAVAMEAGRKYVFDFAKDEVKSFEKSGADLKMAFSDGGVVTLKGFNAAVENDAPAVLKFTAVVDSGQVSGIVNAAVEAPAQDIKEEEAQSGVRKSAPKSDQGAEGGEAPQNIEPAAGDEAVQQKGEPSAQDVADIEPAAGPSGPIGRSNSGYGFNSSFEAQGVLPLDDIGPINPTALIYGLPEIRLDLGGSRDSSGQPASQPPQPVVEIGSTQVYEDGHVATNLYAEPGSAGGILTIVISGIPDGWTVTGPGVFDPAAGTYTFTTASGAVFTGADNPIFTPPADSDVDALGLIFTVTETDPSTGLTGSASGIFDIIVDAVADQPDIIADDQCGFEGASLDVDLHALTGEEVNNGPGSDDGSETITGYEISGVPDGFVLSAGTLVSPGVYVLTPAEIAGLKITPINPNFFGSIELVAKVFTTENPVSDTDFDFTNNNAEDKDTFTLTWKPVINPPSILVNGGIDDAYVSEDGCVEVPVVAALGSNPNVNEFLTVTITGIDPAWGDFIFTVGTYDPASGTWTVVLPPGASLDTVLQFKPAPDSDIDLSGLVATATATDPDAGISASANDGFNVLVDAVADIPNVDGQDVCAEEGTCVPFVITTSVNDTDGSEVIEMVIVRGLPTGVTLTAGSYDSSLGGWVLSPAQLSGLGVNIPDGTAVGDYALSIESIAFEQNTSGSEINPADNRASAFDQVILCIKPDDIPVLVQPETVSVDESNLAPTTSITDQVQADFGSDGPGIFAGNGTFFIGTITSGGDPVSVNFDAASNSYTGSAGGSVVFTLVIQNDGTYTFTLLGTLDHPDGSNHDDSLPLEFGVVATDSDGDSANGVITVHVRDDGPCAADDNVSFDSLESSISGNVIVNDTLSQDAPNTVTKVAFGGVEVIVDPVTGATIDGDHGTLHINADGTYTYTLFQCPPKGGGTAGGTASLDPVASDANGIQSSLTKNGITVSVLNSGSFDISWVNSPDGNGLGIDNLNTSDSKKIWPSGETFGISFEQDAASVSITIAEIGDNNDDGLHGAEYVIHFADGSTYAGEQQFAPAGIVDGHFTFTLNSADFGGKLIASVDVFSSDAGQFKAASMLLNNVQVRYPGGDDCGCQTDAFTYTLTDFDGDSDTAVLTLACVEGTLIVGENVHDNEKSTVPHRVGGDEGIIAGGAGADILVGDAGGGFLEQRTQDYNMVFMLDVSGSMASPQGNSRLSLLVNAMKSLMNDLGAYDDGVIKVHMIAFSTDVRSEGTFVVTDASGLANAITYLGGLSANGYTNYEDPMQHAIDWLQGSEALGGSAITTSYFISDGQPNRFNNSSGTPTSGSSSVVMGEITGSDGTNEVALLQGLSDEVIGVGINIGSDISRLNTIDSDGVAINVTDPGDLTAVLADLNPVLYLDAAGNDVLNGGAGSDIIFGDVLFTDDLAFMHGLASDPGSGWAVFERLEAGHSLLDPSWTREETIAFIRGNAEALAQESIATNGHGRTGGHDVINGGAGNDLIFGQEGNDVITGGIGNDTLYGGSGADRFVFNGLDEGIDEIRDFSTAEGDVIDLSSILAGFDPLTDLISDYVVKTEVGGSTHLAVDVTGAAGVGGAVAFAVLTGVTGLDLDLAIKAVA